MTQTTEERIRCLERKVENLEYLLQKFTRAQIASLSEAQSIIEQYVMEEHS